jgi:hypothetical protein
VAWATNKPENYMDQFQDVNAMMNALQSGFTTVEVQFCNDRLQDGNEQPSGKLYTYKVPTAWNVAVGDWLVVLPHSAYKNVVVKTVHTFPRETANVKWAVQKIDGGFYFSIKQAEDQLQNTIHQIKKRREAELLLEELRRTLPGDALEQITNTFTSLITGSGANAAQPVLQQAQAPTQQPAPQTAASVVQTPATVVQPQVQAEQAQPAQAWQAPAQKPSWAQG